MARSPRRIQAHARSRIGSKELHRLRDHLGKDHGKLPGRGDPLDDYIESCYASKYGTFPSQSGWMTVPDSGCSPAKDPCPGNEPLVESVRTYLANEPHKIVVRVLSRPEPEPQPSDVQIIPDESYARNSCGENSSLKRNDLNNNSNDRLSNRKSGDENRSAETERPADAGSMPTPSDLMQRQPLLAPNKQPTLVITIDDSDQDQDDGVHHAGQQIPNGDLQISESSGRENRYPREVGKTIVSLMFLVLCVCINMCSLSLVHERVPDRSQYGPLPDSFLDNIPPHDWALNVSEYIIMITTITASTVIVMHKYRFIVARRIFFIIGLLYLYRSITMYVTVLPMSSTSYYCSPKANHTTPGLVFERMISLLSGFGLSINGKHTYCGDYIYSGHTTVLVLGYLVISEYSPRKLRIVHWLFFIGSVIGVIFLLLAHGHYTVDVIIAYYISTRLFWTYHSMTKQTSRQGNKGMITREWWYRIFLYFERNVHGPIPRQYDWPLPWPKFLIKFFSRLS